MKKQFEHEAPGVYSTSPAAQPRQRGGLVAVLLVLAILLGGAASLLGILNVRLLTLLSFQEQEDAPISFSATEGEPLGEDPQTTQAVSAVYLPDLGITTEPVTDFLQSYYQLPQGVYITAVEENSAAKAAGCMPGDIIVACNGASVSDNASLGALVAACDPGDTLTLTLYRSQETCTIQLTLE